MIKVKSIYPVLFWVFIFFFVLDYLESEYKLAEAISFTLIECTIYAFIFYINLYVLIPKLLETKGKSTYGLGLLGLLIFISVPFYYSGLGHYLISESDVRNFFSFSLNYILFVVISYLYWYFTLFQQEHKQRLSLQNEKLQAELLMLKSQVSPHFLFNSLNNIYSLSLAKHDNAPLMIEKLSDILRYIIYEGKSKFVPLEREVTLLNNYVDLQLMKKLKAEKNISITTKGVLAKHKLAPLILINIIENCFKHSDVGYNENAHLTIDLTVEKSVLTFKTTNSFQTKSNQKGVGLQNIKQQLQHYYPDNHQLNIEDNNGIFKLALTINL
ncbi:MAG: histidine kinase [Flavobacteriaceae bacterium]|nr:histidine kinase [Flavobacteriaceae bacterium]